MINAKEASEKLNTRLQRVQAVNNTISRSLIKILDSAVNATIQQHSTQVTLCLSGVSNPNSVIHDYLVQSGYHVVSVRSETTDHERYIEHCTHIDFSF